jgi:hypothetical protein
LIALLRSLNPWRRTLGRDAYRTRCDLDRSLVRLIDSADAAGELALANRLAEARRHWHRDLAEMAEAGRRERERRRELESRWRADP